MDMTAFLEGQELLMHVAHGAPRKSDLFGMRRKMERDARLKRLLNGHSRKRQRPRSTLRSKKVARRDGSLLQHGGVSNDSAFRVPNSNKGERRKGFLLQPIKSECKTTLGPNKSSGRLSPKHILSKASSESHAKPEQTGLQAKPRKKLQKIKPVAKTVISGRTVEKRISPRKKIQKIKPVAKPVISGRTVEKSMSKSLNNLAKAESGKNKVKVKGNASTRKPKLKTTSHLKTKACKGLHKLKKYKGYYRCRLCSKTLRQVFLCCNCDWAGCESCIESMMKRKKSNRVGQTKSTVTNNKKMPTEKKQSSKEKAGKSRAARRKNMAGNRDTKCAKSPKAKTTNNRRKITKSEHEDSIKRDFSLKVEMANPKTTTPTVQTSVNTHVNYTNTTSHSDIVSGFTEVVSVRSMTSDELCERLRRSGKEVLVKVAAIIEEEELDGEDVVDLTRRELSLILPKLGMRKKLQKFLAEFTNTSGDSAENGGQILKASKKPWIVSVAERSSRPMNRGKSSGSSTSNNGNVFNKRQLGGASFLKCEL